jgi:hypothetical protein
MPLPTPLQTALDASLAWYDALSALCAAASKTTRHGSVAVLLAGLLDRSSSPVLAHHRDGELVGGAVTHLCSGAVELSNAWSVDAIRWTTS